MKIWTVEDIENQFGGSSWHVEELALILNQLELDRDNAVILVRQAIEAGFDPKSFVNENLLGSGLVESRQAHAVKQLSCHEGSIPSSPNNLGSPHGGNVLPGKQGLCTDLSELVSTERLIAPDNLNANLSHPQGTEGSNPSDSSLRQSASNAEQSGEPLDNGSFLAQ